jgi:hypothetical protein
MSLQSLNVIRKVAYGAMMARTFDVGIETVPPCEDAVPIGVVELGT